MSQPDMALPVNGYCPACGQPSLMLAHGEIVCHYIHCPTPDAVAGILRRGDDDEPA